MGLIILIVLVVIPIIEIAVFIEVGGSVGVWNTVAIIFITAMIGAALLRQQGLQTLHKIQQSLAQNQFPVREMFDGLCLLIAGAFLLTPGFVTDGIGSLLFLPPFRAALGLLALRHATIHASGHSESHHSSFSASHSQAPQDGVIDGEYSDITETDVAEKGNIPPKQVETVETPDKP